MSFLTLKIFVLTVLINRTKVLSFNLEDRNPIVKEPPNGEKGSYFGFSVAQHAERENGIRSTRDSWILVGAPLGKNLQPGTNRSGALFKCPLSRVKRDCVQVETDGKRLDNFDYDDVVLKEPQPLAPPGKDEIKDDQWLGVTVKSQKPGGKVVVCAHRYIQSPNLNNHHYGMGLCYLLSPQLETEEDLQPCKGRPTEKLHQQFGFCQVGTSLAMLDDGFTLMGSPGPYTWRGTIFAKDVVGSFLEKDKTVYKGPLNDNPTPIDKYSYLGMSVSAGRFFGRILTYVSGAPRSQFTGQVYFFNKTRSKEELDILLIIGGEQFASSFGYEILATDIDQDGYDELLVGAPFYYGEGKGGAVYIYDNIRNCTNEMCRFSRRLTGKSESRFGFSMTSLGDINKDGYTDVAIGAPYEDGGGAIYIYLGSKSGLSTEYSQKIKHEGFGIETLGYSLSGGLDMDLNDYPDLLVGAYASDMVILYKTRPIIDIAITIRGNELNNINATKKGCDADTSTNKTCFSFRSCFTISKFKLSQPLDVRYDIKELPKKIPRVSFDNSRTTKYITVKNVNKEYCEEETVYLAESNGDILSPIKFVVNYSLRNNVIDSPILNKTSVKEFEATFQKSCGPDDICKSYLILTTSTKLGKSEDGYTLDLGDEREFILESTVSNIGESAYEAKLFVEHPDVLSYVVLETSENKTVSSNIVCTSNNESTLVSCNLGNPLTNKTIVLRMRFEVKDTKLPQVDIRVFVNSTSVELSNQTSQSLVLALQKIAYYSIQGKLQTPNVFYAGEVKGQSAMHYLEDIGPKVYHSYDITNRGRWDIRDILIEIYWPYQVYSEREQGGKWLLYLEKQPLIEFNQTNICFVEPNIVNPLDLSYSGRDEEMPRNLSSNNYKNAKNRRKRDTDDVIEPHTVTGQDGKQRKVVTMDCLKKTAKCAKITCQIPQLKGNNHVKIEIHSRIWNSTLAEDYSKVDWVSIKSHGNIVIRDPTTIKSNDSVEMFAVETLAYPGVVLADSGINIWIIIGSVLAGLILLVILVLILYKLGFFKRNRIQDHTLSGNLKKQDESSETLLKESDKKAPKKQ